VLTAKARIRRQRSAVTEAAEDDGASWISPERVRVCSRSPAATHGEMGGGGVAVVECAAAKG